jgi:hypothetical protein
MTQTRPPYRYSYERYVELHAKAKQAGLSCREAGEYDYQRTHFERAVRLDEVLSAEQ